MPVWLSVRWRLLLAFLGISAFALLAAAAGTYAFRQMAFVIERITEQRVPSAITALDLSRQAERIVAAAPTLLSARSQMQYREISASITAEVDHLEALLAEIKSDVDPATGTTMEPAVERLRRNLTALAGLVAGRIVVSTHKDALLRRLSNATVAAQRLVAPALVVLDSKFAASRREQPTQGAPQPPAVVIQEIADDLLMQKAQLEFAAIGDGLLKASLTDNAADIAVLGFPLNRSLSALRQISTDLADPRLRARFEQRIADFAKLVEGPDSLLSARRTELGLIEDAERLLQENAGLSSQLTQAVDGLVTAARLDIQAASREALTAQRVGNNVLRGVVALSLLSSLLIVWLYVDRNLVARLRNLSDSMLAIAGGNLRAPLPGDSGDEIGQMAKALAVFRDTAIEVEEKNLREVANARQRLIDAIESINEGFALYDADDRLVLCNSRYQELLYPATNVPMAPGTSFETVIRRAAELGLIKEARGRIDPWVVERLARHRNPVVAEVQHREGDRWIQVSERRIAGGGIVAVYTDVTEVKRHAAQLELARDQAMAATRAKSQFLTNMSHELRTPLNAIIGITEMLKEDAVETGETTMIEPLDRIHHAGAHLLALINEILDLAKIESGKLELHTEEIELGCLLEDAARTAETLAAKNENRLVTELAADLGSIHADPVRIRQVVLNLLSNACKFTRSGTVTLRAGRETGPGGDQVVLSVHDTGIGLTEAQCANLFQEFTQADSSITRKYGGTGLGLAISRRLCRIMGGDITVRSSPGSGSTFSVTLPAGRSPPGMRSLRSDMKRLPIGTRPVGRGQRALVIDDEDTSRDILRQLLTREGFEVVTAESGRRGIELARDFRPSVITLDVLMADPDGWSTLQELKRDVALWDIPVIMVTIVDEENRGYALGAAAYLTKPVNRECLLKALASCRPEHANPRVLVIEDDAQTRGWLTRILREDGWETAEAENGRVALERLPVVGPDIVLLDLMMPEMDGFEFVDEIRRDEKTRHLPLIVLTAADLSDDDHRRLSGGIRKILRKRLGGKDEVLSSLREVIADCMRPGHAGHRERA
ncbi:response regulator [Microvirga sp. HBU67558]|uniref:response regulator n=1 Tax=Microvirga TaxID=186650 RepID=UPI001B36B50F|nr:MULTISPECIES: response regulator [unclassified Microvirga]MBQ0824702.1 response regulator [Microvirga sp. HBU67558]